MKLSRGTKSGIFIAGIAVALALLATEVVRYSRNVPRNHPEWLNGKLLLENLPMGAHESLSTRNSLYRNRLNLHAWHGYNEFLLTKVFPLGELTFDVCLAEDAYLYIVFNKNAESLSAVRLSRNARYPSVYVIADNDGRFLEQTPILNVVLTDTWHFIKIAVHRDQVYLEIDGNQNDHWKITSHDNQVVGFRSGAGAASVDNVTVVDARGNTIIEEGFRNEIHFWLLLAGFLVSIGALIGATFLLVWVCKRDLHKTALWVVLIECVAICIVAILFAFDFFFWSGQYPYATFVPLEYHAEVSLKKARVEAARASFFKLFKHFDTAKLGDSPDMTRLLQFLAIKNRPPYQHGALQIKRSSLPPGKFEEIADDHDTIRQYSDSQPSSSYTVMILGTSQTWGEGARRRADQFAFAIHDSLSEKLPGDVELVTVNAAIRGGDSSELIERFKDRLYLLEPDVVVANLSNNDTYKDPEIFRTNLTSLAEFNTSRGIQTLFVLEANSRETNDDRLAQLKQFHQITSDVAEAHRIPCLDLNGYLAGEKVYDSGILWWDYVHLTSYGQKLAADFVAQSVANLYRHR